MTDFAALLHAGITDDKYHADITSLSSTGARKVLACPAKFKWQLDHPPAPTSKAFDFGKLAHRLVLGEGSQINIVDAPDWRGKDARDQRDAAYAIGAVPVLRSEYDAARQLRDSVFNHEAARALFADGVAELSGYWRDEPTDVQLRFRPDWMTEDGRVICADLKTTISADPAEFGRSVGRYGYHLQAAWYLEGLRQHGIDDPRLLFVCAEKTPPYLVSVIELDDEAIAEGRRMMRTAVDLYARCAETGIWPGYGDDINLISLPMWALSEMEISI